MSEINQPLRARRVLLFVPAVRPDRFTKALATGADVVCIDLEDGVGFGAKDEARREAMELLVDRKPTSAEVMLRINDPNTELGQVDLKALRVADARPDALILPKVSAAGDVRQVEAALSGVFSDLPLVVMIESARGLASAEAIAAATPNVVAVFFGAIDFSADVGCAVDWDALLYARSRVVLAAALAGVATFDSPFMDVPALDVLADECRRARRLGFAGKAAIHPSQVGPIQDAFSPGDEEVSWARKIVAAYEENEGGVLLVDGQLIERPVISAAQRTLALAARGNRPGRGN